MLGRWDPLWAAPWPSVAARAARRVLGVCGGTVATAARRGSSPDAEAVALPQRRFGPCRPPRCHGGGTPALPPGGVVGPVSLTPAGWTHLPPTATPAGVLLAPSLRRGLASRSPAVSTPSSCADL